MTANTAKSSKTLSQLINLPLDERVRDYTRTVSRDLAAAVQAADAPSSLRLLAAGVTNEFGALGIDITLDAAALTMIVKAHDGWGVIHTALSEDSRAANARAAIAGLLAKGAPARPTPAPETPRGGQVLPYPGGRGSQQPQGEQDPNPQPPVRTTSAAPGAPRRYDQVTYYGRDGKGATALTIDHGPRKRGEDETPTINLSLARAIGQRTQDGVDWDNKITIRCEDHEVAQILAVLLGELPSARFAGHGRANEKWLEVSETDGDYAGSVRVTIGQTRSEQGREVKDIRSCNIPGGNVLQAIGIFNRCVTSAEGLGAVSLDRAMARVGDLAHKANVAKANRPARGQGGNR
jgi:hypothetical protein